MNSCKECQDDQEPTIFLNFYENDSSYSAFNNVVDTVFSSVRVINNRKEIQSANGGYHLPINLHQDSVTYVFRTGNIYDTLTLTYHRNFLYENNCGFEHQLSNFRIIEPTSFDSVSFLYETNIGVYF